ncbi:putative f-box domain protein [Botrytis fragariae]|uniref:Putative f-box domain protein n=1 Tax=Botrytis fragariae TaxID=1964551 RepID=A0A8H6EID9_9HELO|nr:putative f-box domain protein [Botrytis fragariae]KAF5873389.1 putative f-box domain protein [Botrytis fragariae]
MMGRITQTARTDAVVMAENKPTAHNYAVTQEQRKSTSSALLPLPAEIIRMIAGLLPDNYAACLTLCSRSMREILGDRCLKAMKNPPPQTFNFMRKVEMNFVALLAKDLPQHFACFECARIHRARTIKWPNNITDRLGCVQCTRSRQNIYCLKFLSPFEIHFPQVYLATKQHRSGIDIGFPLEAFRHQEVTHDQSTNITSLLSVDARFVSNELLLRSQIWILVPQSRKDRTNENLGHGGLSTRVCKHSERYSLEFMVSELVRSTSSRTRTAQCHQCWMDLGIRRKHCGDAGTAIIITKWINLGAGLDPNDGKWQSHIGRKGLRHKQPLVNIQKAFEDQEGLSMEEFTSGNQEKLFSERRNQPSN